MLGSKAQEKGLTFRWRPRNRNSGGEANGRSKSINKDNVYRYSKKKACIKSNFVNCRVKNRNKKHA